MKILSHKFFLLLVFLLRIMDVFAQGPPNPGDGDPPIGPGLAIDENIVILIIVAILLGVYVIYKFKLKTKPSV